MVFEGDKIIRGQAEGGEGNKVSLSPKEEEEETNTLEADTPPLDATEELKTDAVLADAPPLDATPENEGGEGDKVNCIKCTYGETGEGEGAADEEAPEHIVANFKSESEEEPPDFGLEFNNEGDKINCIKCIEQGGAKVDLMQLSASLTSATGSGYLTWGGPVALVAVPAGAALFAIGLVTLIRRRMRHTGRPLQRDETTPLLPQDMV